ncbi:MAG: septal ring lytic transglycosylase RlpA family protein [Bdellovibrionales bacterium]|nr:septal ring lytic transglycosylase RlpA family protein [Bdellovibrionales bacterium]
MKLKTKKGHKIFGLLICLWMALLSGCYSKTQIPQGTSKSQLHGYASWYGGKFHGRKTASGEVYDQYKLTAAHKTLPFHTWVRVTNLSNGKSVVVKVNDRGPFVRGRVIDLSRRAAEKIDMIGSGTAKVLIEIEKKPRQSARNMTYIQLGSFSSQGSAEKYSQSMEDRVGDVNIGIYEENSLFKVWLGPYATQLMAQKSLSHLKRKKIEGFILHP